MKPDQTISKTRKLITAFAGDQSGAVAAYVAILMVVLIGFVGLAVDFGRLYTTHTQAQSAADAAALAAATQLDGKADAIDRAIIAAMGTPLVNNNHDFAQGDATVQIVQLRFLHSLPAHDDLPITDAHVTTNPANANYVEATTETLTQFNAFLAAVGAGTSDTLATAVAGNSTMQCEIPPLMICNPWENPLAPDEASTPGYVEGLVADLRGVTLLAKTQEGGVNSWDSGVMALLDPPPTCVAVSEDGLSCEDWDMTTNTGTKAVALSMAMVPEDFCYPETPLSIRTGQASAMRSAVNIWFDIYENPFFGAGKYRKDPRFRPARNVTKGYITDWVETTTTDPDTGVTTTSTSCDTIPVDDPNIALGLPPDTCFATGPDLLDFSSPIPCDLSVKQSHKTRIGNGDWNIQQYWLTNHGIDVPAADTCSTDLVTLETACVSAGSTRYEVYRWEIVSGNIPDNKTGGVDGLGKTNGEDGAPICYSGDQPPNNVAPNDSPDRRLLSVAVINCLAEGVTGNSVPNSEAVFFAEMFVIRPIRGGSDGNIWLEFVDFKESGDLGVHDIIQLYR